MQKQGIQLTSAYTREPLILERDEIMGLEPVGRNESRDMTNPQTKVYTKTKGNFYVQEPMGSVSKVVFTEIVKA